MNGMRSSQHEAQIAAHLTQVQMVVAAIAGSVSLLAGVTFLLANAGKLHPLGADGDKIQLILAPLAVALLGIAPALKRALFKRAEAEGFGDDVGRWLAAHRTAVLVASALREGAALLGFLMGLLTGQALFSYLFSGLALATLIFDWPKAGDLEEG